MRTDRTLEQQYRGQVDRIFNTSVRLIETLKANKGTPEQIADAQRINDIALKLYRTLLKLNV